MSDSTPSSPPEPPTPGPFSGGGAWRWAPLLLVAVAWIAHAPVRGHGWVLDDVHLVRDNPAVARGPSAIPGILAAGASGSIDGVQLGNHGPVALASFALEAPLWQRADGTLKPAGFHLTNLLLHGLCVLLIFRVGLAFAPRRPLLALGAALVFAAHPMHVGTVSALMGRAAILAALFALLAALAWRRFGGVHAVWLPIAALLYLLALLSHPVALGLPLVLALGERARRASTPPTPLARLGVLAFALPLAIFFASGGGSMGVGVADLPPQGAGTRLMLGIEGLLRLLVALLLPVGLRGDHSDEAIPGAGYELGSATWVALALVVLVSACLLLRRRRAGTMAFLWFAALALAVPAALALPAGVTLELRWAYVVTLPLVGFGGLLAEGLLHARGASPAFARARLAMVGVLMLLCLVGLTHREAEAWRDDDAFHEQLLDRNPRHVRAMVRYAESQRLAAERHRAESMALRADDEARAYLIALSRDALAKADRWSQRAVRHELGEDRPDAWRVRGFVLLALNRSGAALRSLERARDLDPLLKEDPATLAERYSPERLAVAAKMYASIARAREALGERERAADAYEVARRLDPDNADLMFRSGMTLCRVNRYAEGLERLLLAQRMTEDPDLRRQITEAITAGQRAARSIARRLIAEGHAAKADGKMRKAVSRYEEALEVNPASEDAWIHAAWLRGHWFGNYEQAKTYFARAEALLTKGNIPREDPRWKKIAGYRQLLKEQRAEEDREQAEGGDD